MTTLDGAHIIAHSLKQLGVTVIFGIVGIPVLEVAEACQKDGIRFIGFRNEQAASYAASAWGYLTGQPGVCLVVSGPGAVHALAGIFNARENCWPLVVIAGSTERNMMGRGGFQDLDQVALCEPHTKYAKQPINHADIPNVLTRAFDLAIQGRPGATYVDLQILFKNICYEFAANPDLINDAAQLLLSAKRPLIIVGKGANYAQVEAEVKTLVDLTGIPVLPTPMGKGVISDDDPNCISAARSLALKQADVVLLLGARLNWILHYGRAPRFSTDVKWIQVDISPEEMGQAQSIDVPLVGHLRPVLRQLISALQPYRASSAVPIPSPDYLEALQQKIKANEIVMQKRIAEDSLPLDYYPTFDTIRTLLPDDAFIVSEGANTMDISRSLFPIRHARSRLDAGTMGTMGPSMGYAIAAQLLHPDRRVVAIVGDSAFGFSAMELETAARYRLPLIIVVVNNNGIYYGLNKEDYTNTIEQASYIPSFTLLPDARYELMADAFNGRGYLCRTKDEITAAVKSALLETERISVINILIRNGDATGKLAFAWQDQPKV
ncbi:2-hydroxyacyl-CoA lyase 1 [Syncephalis fuscata]|nr:2-hydroxyacyl-CoA lyase 1 [Syncephalis fuscata]